MNSLKLFTVVLALQISSVFALESDQFLTLTKELKDISKELNQHVNNTVEETLKWANTKDANKFSCQDLQVKSVKKFRGFIVHKIEHWLETEHAQDIYPAMDVSTRTYYKDSIYKWRMGWMAQFFPMGRNLRFGEVYLGADKLAHFFSTGLRYQGVYTRALKRGASQEVAYQKAIDYGVRLEKTILGYWPIGVFSFGDLEANFQGLLFNNNFCEGNVPYLVKVDNRWILQRKIDLKDYINPNFDETYNVSYFMKSKWKKIRHNFPEQCELFETESVQKRWETYASLDSSSYSMDYLNQLIKNSGGKDVPDRKARNSLWTICPNAIGSTHQN